MIQLILLLILVSHTVLGSKMHEKEYYSWKNGTFKLNKKVSTKSDYYKYINKAGCLDFPLDEIKKCISSSIAQIWMRRLWTVEEKTSDFLFNHLPGSSTRLVFLTRYMEHRYTLYVSYFSCKVWTNTHEWWTHHEESKWLQQFEWLEEDEEKQLWMTTLKRMNPRLILDYWLKRTEGGNQAKKTPPSASICWKVKKVQGRCKSHNDFTSEQHIVNSSDSLSRLTKRQHVWMKIQRSQLFPS